MKKSVLIFYIILALVLGYTGYLTYQSITHQNAPSFLSQMFAYSSTFYITMFIAFSPFNTRFGLATKSDSDFLALLPLEDKEIIASLIVGVFVVNAIFLSVFVYWFIIALGLMGVLIIPAFSLLSSSLPAVFYALSNKKKLLIDLVIVLWFISAIFDFPLSPLSMFFGHPEGYLISYALAFLVFYIALKKFNFSTYSNTLSVEKGEIKGTISFKYSNPFILFLYRNLRIIEIGGRVNWMGTSSFISKRVELWKVLAISSALAVSLYFILPYVGSGAIVYALVWALFVINGMASSVFIDEPIWLDMNVMTPREFAVYYLTSKALSFAIILSPFAILSIVLGYVVVAMGFLVFIPLYSIFAMSLFARFYPQKDTTSVNISPMRIVVFLLIGISIFVLLLSSRMTLHNPSSLPVILGLTAFYLGISLPFLLSKRYWESTIQKIVTSVT